MEKPYNQSFQNHGRIVPGFHFVTFGILAINLIWSVWRMIRGFSFETLLAAAMAVALVLLFFYARLFALSVQDRVIRLEERMRMERLLPGDLKPRIGDFTVPQLVSLRFASDAELPELARKVLDDKLEDRKAIKRLVKNWRADFLRA
jgi:hypothetical protein